MISIKVFYNCFEMCTLNFFFQFLSSSNLKSGQNYSYIFLYYIVVRKCLPLKKYYIEGISLFVSSIQLCVEFFSSFSTLALRLSISSIAERYKLFRSCKSDFNFLFSIFIFSISSSFSATMAAMNESGSLSS